MEAITDENSLMAANVAALKAFLASRNLATSGLKLELQARVRDALLQGLDDLLQQPDGLGDPLPPAGEGAHAAQQTARIEALEAQILALQNSRVNPVIPEIPAIEHWQENLAAKYCIIFKRENTVWVPRRMTLSEALLHCRAVLGVAITKTALDHFRSGYWHLMAFEAFVNVPAHFRSKIISKVVDGEQCNEHTVHGARATTELQVITTAEAWHQMTVTFFGPTNPITEFVAGWALLLTKHLRGDRAITVEDAVAWMEFNFLALRDVGAIGDPEIQAAFRKLDLAAIRQASMLLNANRQAARDSGRKRSRSPDRRARSRSADRQAGRARALSPARNLQQQVKNACRDYNLRTCTRPACNKTHVCFSCGSTGHKAGTCSRG